MLSASGGALLGDIKAMGVSGRGFTPEELAENALDRIISISSSADPVIMLTLNTLPLDAGLLTIAVALVVVSDVLELFPYIAATLTIFGFATIYSL